MYRVEDKYILDELQMRALEARLSAVLEFDANQNSEDGYGIYSVYFDDIFDTHLTDTVDGNFVREKYRIRIYDNSFDVIKLEVKQKMYNRVAKISASITKDEMDALINGECIENPKNNPAINKFNIAIKSRMLRPKVIVAYDRKAYVYDAGNVRITFDRNIRLSDNIDLFGKPDTYYTKPEEYNAVLEVKYDEFLPDFIAGLLEMGNMQQTAYSKYVLCRNNQTKFQRSYIV